ncbi:hypothetical protein AVEN_243300-1 [Araneus ventricosus]|uniref:Uncharacterized protein n=1 Tax=Araneus ventricosus TaxID=182803 RepID=A0A4Y2VL91_ARAVE|nr:hypothetical protein AVEN_243300-1 [Araneus ventricosus]
MFESGVPIVAYIKGSSEDAYKFVPKRSFSEEYQRKVTEPGRTIRAVTNSNSSETLIKNNSSEAYHFDYLVKDPQGNLHFHIQQKYENGTVKGFYGHGGAEDRYLVVSYVADAKGYRATVRKGKTLQIIF